MATTGSATRAEEYLANTSTPVSRTAIARWARVDHADRYAEICDKEDDRISRVTAAEVQDNIRTATQVQTLYLDRMLETADRLRPEDLPSAFRNVAVGQGVNHDKVNIIRGRPSSIVEHRSIDDILRKLSGFKVATVIDSTATEIPEQLGSEDDSIPQKAA